MAEIKRRITINKKKKQNKDNRKGNNPYGRPEVYTEQIGAYICRELMNGRTITSIAKDKRIPSLPTIYGWLNRLGPNYKEEFFNSYLMARRVQAEVLADETKDISDERSFDIPKQALRVKTRQWLAAHLLPTKFSDKMEITGKDGKDLVPMIPTKVIFNFVKAKKDKL